GLVDSTVVLIERIKQGDSHALDQLARACLPELRRFAHGRLPRAARGMVTTQDIVADALRKSLEKVEAFHLRHEGAFLAYARTAVIHEIIDQTRRAGARPRGETAEESLAAFGPSPVEEVMGREFLDRYEQALKTLTPEQYQAF